MTTTTTFRKAIAREAATLVLILLIAMTAGAQGVDYIDADGTLKNTATDDIADNDTPTVIDSNTYPFLDGGWYVVYDTFSFRSFTFYGDAHLILADGASMTIEDSPTPVITINGDLTIYGQSGGTGTLTNQYITYNGIQASGNITINGGIINFTIGGDYGIYASNNVTINGGTVNATCYDGNGIYAGNDITINNANITTSTNSLHYAGIQAEGDITINASKVNAGNYLGSGIQAGNDITINTGIVNASSGNYGTGIQAGGTITLGGAFVTSSSYDGTVIVAIPDGYSYSDGNGNNYSNGTLTDEQKAAIAGKTLVPPVSYTNADGGTQVLNPGEYTVLTGNEGETELNMGWYVVCVPLNYSNTINISEMHLILTDGCRMNVGTDCDAGRIDDKGIQGGELYIYGQSAGSGKLSVYTKGMYSHDCIHVLKLFINGGTLTANSNGDYSDAILADFNLTINGGIANVTATGSYATAICLTQVFNYNGGNLYANAANGEAIYFFESNNCNINWRSIEDRITIGSGGINTANGTATFNGSMIDGSGNIYSGTTSLDDLNTRAATNGSITLQPCALADDDSALDPNLKNAAIIDAANGISNFKVILAGRTLYKDGDWNTLCLPFNITLAGSSLDGAIARPLTSASITNEGTTLNLTFGDPVDELVAGTPYIIKWVKADGYVDDDAHNIVNPVFSGVTIDKTDRNKTCDLDDGKSISFVGNYTPVVLQANDNTKLYLGSNNNLYYPSANITINALRAYFQMTGIAAGTITNARMIFGEGANNAITGVQEVQLIQGVQDDSWYTLDGRKVSNGKLSNGQMPKGIYIHNGKKEVIK